MTLSIPLNNLQSKFSWTSPHNQDNLPVYSTIKVDGDKPSNIPGMLCSSLTR